MGRTGFKDRLAGIAGSAIGRSVAAVALAAVLGVGIAFGAGSFDPSIYDGSEPGRVPGMGLTDTSHGVVHPSVDVKSYFWMGKGRWSTKLSGWTEQPSGGIPCQPSGNIESVVGSYEGNPDMIGYLDGSEYSEVYHNVAWGWVEGTDLLGRFSLEPQDVPSLRSLSGFPWPTQFQSAIKGHIVTGTDSGNFEYRVWLSDGTKTDWMSNDQVAGYEDWHKPIVGVAFRLTGELAEHYDVSYNATVWNHICTVWPEHAQYHDNSAPTANGAWNPSTGEPTPPTYTLDDNWAFDPNICVSTEHTSQSPNKALAGMVFNISPKWFDVDYVDGLTGQVFETRRIMYGEDAGADPEPPAHDGYIPNGFTGDDVTGTYDDGTFKQDSYVRHDSQRVVNYRAAGPEPTTASISCSKTLEGGGLSDGQFTFTLRDSNGTALQTKSNAANGSIAFDAIRYESAGTYRYTVRENATSDANVVIDAKTVNVTVTVTENSSNKLVASVSCSPDATFRNTLARGSVTLRKLDADFEMFSEDELHPSTRLGQGGAMVVGAEYTVYKDTACTQPTGYKVVIGSDGQGSTPAELPLSGNPYYVKETKAPVGYGLDTAAHEVYAVP